MLAVLTAMMLAASVAVGAVALWATAAPSCMQIARNSAQPSAQAAELIVVDCNRRAVLSHASAARIARGDWVTAAHAFPDASMPASAVAWLVDVQGHAQRVREWEQHPLLDMASFRAPGMHSPSYEIAPARTGEAVTAWATQDRSLALRVAWTQPERQVNALIINGRSLPQPTAPVLILRGAVRPGYSGGPIIDRQGRIVAMTYARSTDQRWSFAIPASQLRDFAYS
jgi:hypothetical protein